MINLAFKNSDPLCFGYFWRIYTPLSKYPTYLSPAVLLYRIQEHFTYGQKLLSKSNKTSLWDNADALLSALAFKPTIAFMFHNSSVLDVMAFSRSGINRRLCLLRGALPPSAFTFVQKSIRKRDYELEYVSIFFIFKVILG